MEKLTPKPQLGLPKARRKNAFALGARSAFDLFGFGTFRIELFRSPWSKSVDPASTIAEDIGRVMRGFGRSTECARQALSTGIEIEQLKPGCTAKAKFPGELSSRRMLHAPDTALKSSDLH